MVPSIEVLWWPTAYYQEPAVGGLVDGSRVVRFVGAHMVDDWEPAAEGLHGSSRYALLVSGHSEPNYVHHGS